MTTFAAPQEVERRLAELDARTTAAWTAYRDELAGLAAQRYDDAEPLAWERLQTALVELELLRAEPAQDGADAR